MYNLEVDAEHVFHVAADGVLVHNSCPGDVAVIDSRTDTLAAQGWDGHEVLDLPNWTPDRNHDWVQSLIDQQKPVYKASPEHSDTLWDAINNRPRVYAEELQQLRDAGYIDVDDYLLPPSFGGR